MYVCECECVYTCTMYVALYREGERKRERWGGGGREGEKQSQECEQFGVRVCTYENYMYAKHSMIECNIEKLGMGNH